VLFVAIALMTPIMRKPNLAGGGGGGGH